MAIPFYPALILLAAVWGGSFPFMRIAAPVLGPIWLVARRVLIADLVLLPLFTPPQTLAMRLGGGLIVCRHRADIVPTSCRPIVAAARLWSRCSLKRPEQPVLPGHQPRLLQ